MVWCGPLSRGHPFDVPAELTDDDIAWLNDQLEAAEIPAALARRGEGGGRQPPATGWITMTEIRS